MFRKIKRKLLAIPRTPSKRCIPVYRMLNFRPLSKHSGRLSKQKKPATVSLQMECHHSKDSVKKLEEDHSFTEAGRVRLREQSAKVWGFEAFVGPHSMSCRCLKALISTMMDTRQEYDTQPYLFFLARKTRVLLVWNLARMLYAFWGLSRIRQNKTYFLS